MSLARRVRDQNHRQRGPKVYSLHAPEVECIGKGKAHRPYEFGVKVSVVTTLHRSRGGQFVAHVAALPDNPYDGHTLATVIPAMQALVGNTLDRAIADAGYRGHNAPPDYKFRSHGEVDSDRYSGRVRLLPPTLEATMQTVADRPEAPTAIRSDLGAIFVSLELSRSTWLITSLSPGGGEKMSKHVVRGGDVAGLLERFAQLREKTRSRTGKVFSFVVIQEAGLDGFWIDRVLQNEGIESHVVDPASIGHRVGVGGRRLTGSTARRWFARCWHTSGANLGCARWSRHRLPRKRTAAASAASARY